MKDGRPWIAGVIAVLLLTVGANAWVIWLAHGRDAAVVEPDYYRKAVAWDSLRAAEERSAALGWTVDATLGRPDAAGEAALEVRLAARDGAPLEGASVTVAAIHNRIAGRAVRADLAPAAPGVYAARLPLGLRGLWELDVEATRGTERFIARLRRDTERGGP
jgi:nitrogen fixation protein FixH